MKRTVEVIKNRVLSIINSNPECYIDCSSFVIYSKKPEYEKVWDNEFKRNFDEICNGAKCFFDAGIEVCEEDFEDIGPSGTANGVKLFAGMESGYIEKIVETGFLFAVIDAMKRNINMNIVGI